MSGVLHVFWRMIIDGVAESDSLENSPPQEMEVIDQIIHVIGSNYGSIWSIKRVLDDLYGDDFSDAHWEEYSNILTEYGLVEMNGEIIELTSKGLDVHVNGGWIPHLKRTSGERVNMTENQYELHRKKNQIKRFVKKPYFALIVFLTVFGIIAFMGWVLSTYNLT